MSDVVEVVEEVSTADIRILVAAGTLGGLVLGAAIGYAVANKTLKTKYERLAEEEIAEAKAFYSRLNKNATPEQAVASLAPELMLDKAVTALKQYQGEAEEQAEDDESVETTTEVNVFDEHESNYVFDLEEEIKRRSPDKPYVISEEEWGDGQEDYQQVTLTYYAGDATLADEKEEHIPDSNAVIGIGTLDRFGHGCADANTVFVRNEKMGIQFEVVRSDGKYAHEVLGLQHSSETFARRPRRHRMDDD